MSIEDGDFSKLLTDLSIIGHQNREPKLLLNIKRGSGKPQPAIPAKTKYYNGLVKVLSQSLAERLARKLSRRQYKSIRNRATSAIRRMP